MVAHYYCNIDSLRPNELSDILFICYYNQIGLVYYCFSFQKKRATALQKLRKDTENHALVLKDFKYKEVERIYQPIFIAPGRKAVYTAVIGLDTRNYQIRQCSTKKHYNFTESTKYLSRLRRLKDTKDLTSIETSIPTQNTCS